MDGTPPRAGQLIRVLVTGSRAWTNTDRIAEALGQVIRLSGCRPHDVLLIHGACPVGADALADEFATQIGMRVQRFPADWETFGKAAGFRRNAEMVNLGADVCLAFIRNKSRGASMTARMAEKAGIPTKIFEE
ncbi:DUF2493 domain-containing protein [Streptomyces sp. NPDC055036]